MRLFVFAGALVIAAILLGFGFYFTHTNPVRTVPLQANSPAREQNAAVPPLEVQTLTEAQLEGSSRPSAPQQGLTSAAPHSDYLKSRIAQLQGLSMENDGASLNTILSELNNRDPEIRKAALEAAIQFGSRDAIPSLLDAAAQTDDPKEKQAFLDAAEFLKLPSLTEVMQARGMKPVQLEARPKLPGAKPFAPAKKQSPSL